MRVILLIVALFAFGVAAQAQTAQGVAAGCRHQLSAYEGQPLPNTEAQSQAGYCVAAIRHITERQCPQIQIDERAAVRQIVTYMEAHPERSGEPAETVLPDALTEQGCKGR